MHEELDGGFVLFAAPAMARELLKSANPTGGTSINDFKDLLLYAQKTLEAGFDDGDLDEFREFVEELFLQGIRDQPTITKLSIANVIEKSFAVARALEDIVALPDE